MPTSLCREHAFIDQLLPESNTMIEIDLENTDGGPTLGCSTDQDRAFPSEMARPFMTAGIE
jgi:hypothetical protein